MNRDTIQNESAIVWTEPTDLLDYVRAAAVTTTRRTGRIAKRDLPPGSRLIGFADLAADVLPEYNHRSAHGIGFERRVFFLLPIDRDSQPQGPFRDRSPAGAADPRKIAPNRPGRLSSRAWNSFRSKEASR